MFNGVEILSVVSLFSRASCGLQAPLVYVEAHISPGLPKFSIVGLPEAAVKESKDRVRGALIQLGFSFPAKRIIINLAPADLPKEGGRFDLPIALSILIASKQLDAYDLHSYEFAGELSLNGELRYTPGLIPFAIGTQSINRKLILPNENATEAAIIEGLSVLGANNLMSVCEHVAGISPLPTTAPVMPSNTETTNLCLADISGQAHAKRALEIAASGDHSLLMIGPPGTGKTMLASRLGTLLPPLSLKEAIEVAAIRSVSTGGFDFNGFKERPFRRPHHTASSVSLVGGGRYPKPGEISLAHLGILFLDELPEFDRKVLEVLREPLESGTVHISRAQGHAHYPAQCLLVAAMNPCPCGHLGDPLKSCVCTEEQIKRYRSKLSGPLLDRIDMHIQVPRLPKGLLSKNTKEETSEDVKKRVVQTRQTQLKRSPRLNAHYTTKDIKIFCTVKEEAQLLLDNAMEKLGLSARAYHRILKVARTIADLALEKDIHLNHVAEAIQYRQLDRGE